MAKTEAISGIVYLNKTQLKLFISLIAGKLQEKGITTKEWDIKKCKDVLSETVLASRLIRILNEHHKKIFETLKEYENI